MATTTNYSWVTPDDTSLVKDGAAAIRSLGSSIDTTTKNLNPSTTLGDIEYRSATANTNTRLGIGTTGQVLQVTGGVPAWGTVSSGGMTLIQTITASAATSVSFTSIPTTYKTLIFVANKVHQSSVDVSWTARFNNDSGTNYQYSGSFVDGNGTVLGSDVGTGTSTSGVGRRAIIPGTDNFAGSDNLGYCELFIYNADSTGTKPYFYTSSGYWDSASARSGALNMSGTYSGTAAITQIDLIRSFTQTITGTFRLFGVS